MRAGKLRHKITIQTKTETADALNSYSESWSTFATVWADIRPLKGVEATEHKKLGYSLTRRIWIRYLSGVTTKMRISWGSKTLEIVDVRNSEERNAMLELIATELST